MKIKISEKEKFILRVAGIFIRENSVLLHRADFEDLWALPGGGCEYFEVTEEALKREMLEELTAEIEIQSLAFTVENFFHYSQSKIHEIGFYYFAQFAGKSLHFNNVQEFIGIEKILSNQTQYQLHFKWVPLDQLAKYNLKPSFLREKLMNLKSQTTHIVHRDLSPSN